VRLYGRAQGHSSHAQVTAGFSETLRASHLLSGFVALDLAAISTELQRERDALSGLGGAATHGVFTGALGHVESMLQHAAHRQRWVMVAPNSTLIPQGLVREVRRVATTVLTPSDWAADVLRELFDLPVLCVAHGVSRDFAVSAELVEHRTSGYTTSGTFKVLHFSTSDRERKGTLELIRAWQLLMKERRLPEQASLGLVLDYAARARLVERLSDEELRTPHAIFLSRVDLAPKQMAELLGSAHVVCQPSRGEAFGLIPLEALCCGVPVVATACTGHSQYLHDGLLGAQIVAHHALAPIDDVPEAMAPEVRVDDIAQALVLAFERWGALHEDAVLNADALYEQWSWRRQLAPFLAKLNQ
jgi:glycosyltransferase involved in cell wall biosynthesis